MKIIDFDFDFGSFPKIEKGLKIIDFDFDFDFGRFPNSEKGLKIIEAYLNPV